MLLYLATDLRLKRKLDSPATFAKDVEHSAIHLAASLPEPDLLREVLQKWKGQTIDGKV